MSSSFSITSGMMLNCHSSGKGHTGESLDVIAVPWKRPRIRAPERLERSDWREATEWEEATEKSGSSSLRTFSASSSTRASTSKAGELIVFSGACICKYSATLASEEGIWEVGRDVGGRATFPGPSFWRAWLTGWRSASSPAPPLWGLAVPELSSPPSSKALWRSPVVLEIVFWPTSSAASTKVSRLKPPPGVSILMSYGENPHYVKLPIFKDFMENSTKFMKNSDLTKWTQNLR